MVAEVEHPTFGPMTVTNTPFFFDGTPTRVQGPAPLLGEHNVDVLSNMLGYTDTTIEDLRARGIIGEEPAVADRDGR